MFVGCTERYKVTVVTGTQSWAGTDANVYIKLFGDYDNYCGDISLNDPNDYNDFERGE